MFCATTLLYSATTLLFRARLFSASALLFSTVLYLWVPIVLRPSHLLLLVYVDKYLYDVHLNN